MVDVHQLIEPIDTCYQHHRITTRPKVPGPGRYDYCYTCSLGYEKAIAALGNPAQADAFVQDLRRNP